MIKKYPCPNPTRNGCGCPSYSSRCYGAIRAVREEFRSFLAQPGPDQGDRTKAAEKTMKKFGPDTKGWSTSEILSRF